MIMLGTTPRRLGWGTALGSFALAALLLPLSPTWAQKSPEKPQATVFAYEIKDDDPTKPSETSKLEEVRVVVANGLEVEQVQADSLDKAVELIKQKVEALAKQSGGPEKQAGQIKALKQALADLEKARAKVVGSEGSKEPAKKEERITVRRLESVSPKLTAEKKAEIDKARSRIDALRKELDEKRQQLTNAQRDLQKLMAAGYRLELRVAEPRLREGFTGRPLELLATTVTAPESPSQAQSVTTLNRSDKDRLESLEKQLAKLLEEVASLKRHEEKAK